MFSLNLPSFTPKIVEKEGKYTIFDPIRRKYVSLTPEEWVRQHFVNYLVIEKGFPKELLANEIAIVLNGTKKRCDTIVYNRFLAPILIAEYKSPAITIKQAVIDQIVRYNMALKVKYLIISNGINHFCCKIDFEAGKYSYLEQIPTYDSLT